MSRSEDAYRGRFREVQAGVTGDSFVVREAKKGVVRSSCECRASVVKMAELCESMASAIRELEATVAANRAPTRELQLSTLQTLSAFAENCGSMVMSCTALLTMAVAVFGGLLPVAEKVEGQKPKA